MELLEKAAPNVSFNIQATPAMNPGDSTKRLEFASYYREQIALSSDFLKRIFFLMNVYFLLVEGWKNRIAESGEKNAQT